MEPNGILKGMKSGVMVLCSRSIPNSCFLYLSPFSFYIDATYPFLLVRERARVHILKTCIWPFHVYNPSQFSLRVRQDGVLPRARDLLTSGRRATVTRSAIRSICTPG